MWDFLPQKDSGFWKLQLNWIIKQLKIIILLQNFACLYKRTFVTD